MNVMGLRDYKTANYKTTMLKEVWKAHFVVAQLIARWIPTPVVNLIKNLRS